MRKRFLIILLTFVFSIFQLFSQELSSSNYISTQSFDIEKIKNFKFEISFETLEFNKVYGNEITIDVYSNNNKILPSINLNTNETIEITTTNTKITPGDFCKIIIYIPREFTLENLVIILKDSINKNDFLIPELLTKNILVNSQNRNIICNNFTGNLTINTINGNANLKNINSSQLTVNSKNGIINIEKYIGDYLYINTDNNITADKIKCDYFTINTKKGNIYLAISQAPFGTSYLDSNSGQIQFFIPKNDNFNLEVHSTTGTFFDKLQKTRFTPRHEYFHTYNNDGATIKINTKSGNIELDEF